MTAAEKRLVIGRAIAGLKWAAKRIGAVTTTLYLGFEMLQSFLCAHTKTKRALAEALDGVQLKQLKFLSAHCYSIKHDDSAVIEDFEEQLLKEASSVERMQLRRHHRLDSMSYSS